MSSIRCFIFSSVKLSCGMCCLSFLIFTGINAEAFNYATSCVCRVYRDRSKFLITSWQVLGNLRQIVGNLNKILGKLGRKLGNLKDYLSNVMYFLKHSQEMLSTAALPSYSDVILCVNTIVDDIDKMCRLSVNPSPYSPYSFHSFSSSFSNSFNASSTE